MRLAEYIVCCLVLKEPDRSDCSPDIMKYFSVDNTFKNKDLRLLLNPFSYLVIFTFLSQVPAGILTVFSVSYL